VITAAMREMPSSVLARALSTYRILWIAFIGAEIIYGITLWFSSRSPSISPGERGPLSEDPLLVPIVLAAVAAAVLGRLVPRLMLTPARLRAAAAGDARDTLRLDRQLSMADLDEIAALPEMERRPFLFLGSWSNACIIQWAAYEAVGIFGLVLGHLRHDPWTFAPFGAVAVLLLLTAKPDLDDLHRLARSAGR
jgi:hypothetical protein